VGHNSSEVRKDFYLTLNQIQNIEKLLTDHELENDVVGLFTFLKSAIEGREYAKFIFTKNLSEVLFLLKQLGEEKGFTIDDLAFLDIGAVLSLYGSSWDINQALTQSINHGKENYKTTLQLHLPPIIFEPKDIYSFKWPDTKPNFITLKQITALVVTDLSDPQKMKGAIILIPSADPGFDWIFTHNIAGFITAYGGVNSHMAIRAGELGIPAIIGTGEKLYEQLSKAQQLFLDCANNVVEIIR
jgi:phosphohistidine swiveling domain-containing protein